MPLTSCEQTADGWFRYWIRHPESFHLRRLVLEAAKTFQGQVRVSEDGDYIELVRPLWRRPSDRSGPGFSRYEMAMIEFVLDPTLLDQQALFGLDEPIARVLIKVIRDLFPQRRRDPPTFGNDDAVSSDSREGRVRLGRKYIHEARVTWDAAPLNVRALSPTQVVGFAHAIELIVKAAMLYANQTPPTHHRLDVVWKSVPVGSAFQARYLPLVQQAATIRTRGAYPGCDEYDGIVHAMDQDSWTSFVTRGEDLTTFIEAVGRALGGLGAYPADWLGAQSSHPS